MVLHEESQLAHDPMNSLLKLFIIREYLVKIRFLAVFGGINFSKNAPKPASRRDAGN
jgi:hypothetical protein